MITSSRALYKQLLPSKILDQRADFDKVELDFSRPGKPTDNAFIEAFDGRLRVANLAKSKKHSLK